MHSRCSASAQALLERAGRRGAQCALQRRRRPRRTGGQPRRPLARCDECRAGGHGAVDQPQLQAARRAPALRFDRHLEGALVPHRTGNEPAQSAIRNERNRLERQVQERLLAHHHEIGGEHECAGDAADEAFHGGDDGLGAVDDGPDRRVILAGELPVHLAGIDSEFLQVSAGAEAAPRSRQHDRAHVGRG
jgi:hypothetical protein